MANFIKDMGKPRIRRARSASGSVATETQHWDGRKDVNIEKPQVISNPNLRAEKVRRGDS